MMVCINYYWCCVLNLDGNNYVYYDVIIIGWWGLWFGDWVRWGYLWFGGFRLVFIYLFILFVYELYVLVCFENVCEYFISVKNRILYLKISV